MLNFDIDRYLRIERGAVAQMLPIDSLIGRLIASGARNLYFLGTGGAAILMQPAALLMQRHSTFPVFTDYSAELVVDGHAALGEGSIVVIPSLSGTTKESVAALEFCKARGATVISLVGHAATPLGKRADHAFVNFAEDDTSCESFILQSLAIALAVMNHRGERADTSVLFAELARLPEALLAAKQDIERDAKKIAEAIAAAPWHIVTGAGATWTSAWYYGMCILEEMQWIRTRPVHASDFFHGTLELVEPGVSLLLFKGEDAARPLVERVEAFARERTQTITVLDSKRFELAGLSPAARALVSPIVLAAALERISAHLEVIRDHPLTTRRYYKRVAYLTNQ